MGTNKETLHGTLANIVINAEAITWNRFYNFLMFNSILVLAWATIFSATTAPSPARPLVLSVISIVGGASCLAWAGVGLRGRTQLGICHAMGAAIEKGWSAFNGNRREPVTIRPLSAGLAYRDAGPFAWCGSLYLLVLGPLLFAVLYDVLLFVSLALESALVAAAVTVVVTVLIFLSLLMLLFRLRALTSKTERERMEEVVAFIQALDEDLSDFRGPEDWTAPRPTSEGASSPSA